MPPNDGYFA
jgi:hypothetical protein